MVPSATAVGELVGVQPDQFAPHLVVVLSEEGSGSRRHRSLPVEARKGSLLEQRPGHRVVDRDQVAPGAHVGVGDDVVGVVDRPHRHAVLDALRFDLLRRALRPPIGRRCR